MSIEIRRPANAEIPEVAELFIAAQADAIPFLRKLHSDRETHAFIAGPVFTQCDVWVAVQDGRIVGMMALNGQHLDHLYILPGYYRRGIGTKLLDLAKKLSPRSLTLYAFQMNMRARAFYEHHGFIAIEFGDGSANEAGEPDILYRWQPTA
jgi:ribosomal protein S18 acetylase RimI-like enzyme